MKKRLIAVAFVGLGVAGIVGANAPSAGALDITLPPHIHIGIHPDQAPCLRLDVVLGGVDIGPLEQPVCL